jgi:hypothetical protein
MIAGEVGAMLYIPLTDNQGREVFINMEQIVAVSLCTNLELPACHSRLVASGGQTVYVQETPEEVIIRLASEQAGKAQS